PHNQAAYRLEVSIEELNRDLAVKRDATVTRTGLDLQARVTLTPQNKADALLETTVSAQSAYNVEATPFSTDSGRVFAREAAADRLADEIARVVRLALRDAGKVAPTPQTK
ncbi:MAG: hypothetical protein WAX89_04185, partial [Alphaproteobacteria bacterium]